MVAFSGGADSAFLLTAAVRRLGAGSVIAATAVSPSLPATELAAARVFAAEQGVRHLTPNTFELDRAGYRANGARRCFHCKTELVTTLRPLAEAAAATIATGTNADDARAGFRPGIAAARDGGAVTPLLDAGLTKSQIRSTSRSWGLSTWNKPAAACLSSRIAYGIPVTLRGLGRVERVEAALREVFRRHGIGVTNLRVRDLGGETARVEVDAEHVITVTANADARAAVLREFEAVDVDPRGFRSGSMNEALPASARDL
ncbi:TIGR00268 family protein [Stackebrandtia soli]